MSAKSAVDTFAHACVAGLLVGSCILWGTIYGLGIYLVATGQLRPRDVVVIEPDGKVVSPMGAPDLGRLR